MSDEMKRNEMAIQSNLQGSGTGKRDANAHLSWAVQLRVELDGGEIIKQKHLNFGMISLLPVIKI